MKISKKLLSLVLALAMLLSLSSVALADNDDWADYQQYVISYAVNGAPTEADAVSMTDIIMACDDMAGIEAASEIQVFFDVLGALDYDAWVAAGKPAGETAADDSASDEASGEASAEADASASGEASGEADTSASGEASGETAAYGDLTGEVGENAVVSYHEDSVTYVSEGVETTVALGDGLTPYLTVDGVNIPMAVGNYDGVVAVDVVAPIFESSDYQSGDKDVDLSTELSSVIYITDEGLQAGQSVLSAAVGGEVADDSITGVTIDSQDVAALSGIRIGGGATVEVSDVTINLSGEGGNDFMGQGAALCATDGATLIARNITANVSGNVRGCTFAGGQATLEVYDSTFNCDAGEYDADASVAGAAMSQPPAGLGVYGNTRLNNMVHYATEYFENCTFVSRNWGCLGVDAVEDGSLTCVGCSITITECGYGAYSIGACVDTFTDCTFDIHNGVVAFVAVNGTVILDGGTIANSDRYGIVTHQAMNLISNVKVLGEGTELNAAYCGIMVKGRSADIEVGDGATITASETNVIIQAQDNDDTGAGTVNTEASVPVYVHDTALEGDIVMSMAPLADSTATMSVTLENATVTGAITLSNAELAIPDGNISFDNIMDVGMLENVYGAREDACYLNVTLTDGAVWNVTETSYVTELTVDATSSVNGTVTEADGYYIVEPANGASAEAASTEAAPAAGGVDASAYADYIHEFLLAELAVNSSMTSDQVENEFMPLVVAGDYVSFPAEMLYGGMLNSGNAMTYDEFVAAGGVY